MVRCQKRRLEPEQPHIPQRFGQPIPQQRLSLVQLKLDQPADIQAGVRPPLCQAGQPHHAPRRLRPKLLYLPLQPPLELVGRDRHTRLATDRELNHAPIIDAGRAGSNGYQAATQRCRDAQRWVKDMLELAVSAEIEILLIVE
jgi:hypothetical protein